MYKVRIQVYIIPFYYTLIVQGVQEAGIDIFEEACILKEKFSISNNFIKF